MCGLGHHSHNTLVLSDAWDLNVDAITFSNAIAVGIYRLFFTIILIP